MAATAYGTVLAALVAALRARAGYRAPDSTATGIPVYHSTQVALQAERAPSWVALGWSGDPDSPQDAGSAGQAAAAFAATRRPREETGTIRGMVSAHVPDGDLGAPARAMAAALAVLDDVDAVLRATPGPDLGLVPASFPMLVVQLGRVSGIRPYLSAGAVVDVEFEVAYLARI